MHRLIVDCSTGKETTVPMSAEEIAAVEAHHAELAKRPEPRDVHAELDALRAEINRLKAS